MSAFAQMLARYAKPGEVAGLYLRPARLVPPKCVAQVEVCDSGLVGDHGRSGKRAVTLLQAEHLAVIAAALGRDAIDAADLRRNVIVAGLNLNALKGRQVRLGTALIEVTGICAPCSRMEKVLGHGGYSAMRGHGGWCARVIENGHVAVGNEVVPVDAG